MKRAATLIFLLLASPLLEAQSLSEARQLYQHGHYAEAKRILTTLPQDAARKALEGKVAAAEGDPRTAVNLLEEATRAEPRNSEFWLALGKAYADLVLKSHVYMQPRYAMKAKESLEKAVALDGSNIDARYALLQYYLLAPVFIGGGDWKAVNEAREIRARDRLAGHKAFARIYVEKREHDLAFREWQEAVKESPAAVDSHAGLAHFYQRQDHNYLAAEHEFETALAADAKWMPGWFYLGRLAAISGRNLKKGKTALERYLHHQPGPDEPPLQQAHYWLSRVYEKEGNRLLAQQQLTMAKGFHPSVHDD